MDSRLIFPTFPTPPAEYDQRFFQDLVRSLDTLVRVVQTPGEGRQTTIVLTNLATSDAGLEPGTVYQVLGALRVALADVVYTSSLSATGSVGSVTFLTPDNIVYPTGRSATGSVGSVTVNFSASVPVTGVPTTGYVGSVIAVV